MGDLTQANLIDEIKAGLGRKNVANDDVSSVEYVRALNLAQSRLTQLHNWRSLDRLVSGTQAVVSNPSLDKYFDPTAFIGGDLIEDILAFRWQESSGGTNTFMRKLIRWPMRQFNRVVDQPLFTGTPWLYVWPAQVAGKEDNLILWYVPNQNYNFEIRYTKKPTLFTTGATTAVSNFEAGLDEALIYFGTYYLLQRTQRKDDATHYIAMFNQRVEEAIASDVAQVDVAMQPRGISEDTGGISDYWRDPFVRGMP